MFVYVHTVCVFPIRCAIVIMPHNQTKTLNQTHSTLCVYMSVCGVCACVCLFVSVHSHNETMACVSISNRCNSNCNWLPALRKVRH